MGYHGEVGWLRGGYLGVDVFFVISGFLITSLLINELLTNDRIALRAFWARRARRLLPALTLVLLAVAVYARWFAEAPALASIRHDGLATLAFANNWRYAWNLGSYFDRFNLFASPLRHTWSLAIEEQFYVVWPFVLLASWKLTRRARDRLTLLGRATAAGAALSAAWMVACYALTHDRSRVYFGTDTRAQGVLIGAALAFFVFRRGVPVVRGWIVVAATAGVAGSMMFVGDGSTPIYTGGFTVVSLATAVLVLAAVRRNSLEERILSVRPLTATGRISYGLYLWHWPIYVFLPHADLLVRIALSFACAWLSYVVVERRIRLVRMPRFASVSSAAVVPIAIASLLGASTTAALNLNSVAVAHAPVGDLRIAFAGDSTMFTLTYYGDVLSVAGVAEYTWAPLGCGLLAAQRLEDDQPTADCARSPEQWSAAVGRLDPALFVVEFGLWDVGDHSVAGAKIRPGDAAFDETFAHALDDARRVMARRGATLVLLEAPCMKGADRQRVVAFNTMLHAYAAQRAGVTTLDWSTSLCRDGKPITRLRPDGVHFDEHSAPEVYRWLVPRLRAIADHSQGSKSPSNSSLPLRTRP